MQRSTRQYPAPPTPLYGASKAGVLHFIRSLAGRLYSDHGIRACTICPGAVRTPLLSDEMWSRIGPIVMTPMSAVVSTVQRIVDGGAMTDARGKSVGAGQDWGLAVEIKADKFYFRDSAQFEW